MLKRLSSESASSSCSLGWPGASALSRGTSSPIFWRSCADLGDTIQPDQFAPFYAQYFKHRPAKTEVGVDKLWGGALIEVEVVASR
jgi:hypothetical protein